MSTYLSQDGDRFFRDFFTCNLGSWVPPVSVSLTTTVPTYTLAGTEVTGGTYSRQTVMWEFETGTSNLKVQNASAVVFPGMPATTAQGFNIYDSNGKRLMYGTFTADPTTTAGQAVVIPAGHIRFRRNNICATRYSGQRDWYSPACLERTLGAFFDIGTYASYRVTQWKMGLINNRGTSTTAPTEVSGGSYAKQNCSFYVPDALYSYVGLESDVTFTNVAYDFILAGALYDQDNLWMMTFTWGGSWNHSGEAYIVPDSQNVVMYARSQFMTWQSIVSAETW